MWDNRDPVMHAYATGPDLNALIAPPHGDPARPDMTMCLGLRSAGCPSAERHVLSQPTGGASPVSTSVEVDSPVSSGGLRHPARLCLKGRADDLKRRRKERDDFLGREGQPSQLPSRKGRRQTLYRCLVQPARGVDASLQNQSLHPLAERQATRRRKKTELFSHRPRCALLTFETI